MNIDPKELGKTYLQEVK